MYTCIHSPLTFCKIQIVQITFCFVHIYINFVQDTHYLQKFCYGIVLMLIVLYYKLYAKWKVFKSLITRITRSSLYLMNICEIETFRLQCLPKMYTSIHAHEYSHIFYTFTSVYHRYFI